MTGSQRTLIVATAIVSTGWLAQTPGVALNIIYTPLSQNNNPQISGFTADINPFDIDGSGLLAVLNHVADVYESVIDDPGTVEITYWWDDFGLAGQSAPAWIVEDSGRVTMSGVRFNSDLVGNFGLPWFIDSTPAADEEFDMVQTLYRDLSLSDQSDRYLGDTPDLFEASFSGNANANAPAGTFLDLVTVAFQEVGHALGMNAGFSNVSNATNTGEGDDFKFDLATSWVHGDTMALKARGFTNPSAGDGKDHIVGNDVVMGGVNTNQRNRPSAADILSIAVTANFDNPDLPRKEFLAGNQWGSNFNWLGGQAPDLDDDVFIRHGSPSSVVLNDPGLNLVQNLTVDEGSNLLIDNTAIMVVLDNTIVQQSAGPGTSAITINEDSELDAVDLRINDGGVVGVFDGLLDIEELRIAEGGLVNGNGVISFIDLMRNDGEINASQPFGLGISTLFINSADGNTVDLDGNTGNGILTADFADVSFTASLSDDFNGAMNIGAGRFINMVQPWTLGGSGGMADGVIDLDGGNDDPDRARLTGGALTVDGGMINASGVAWINVVVTVEPESNVVVGSGANLEFNSTTTLNGGTYTVGPNANLEFDGTTTVDSADFVIDPTGVISFDGPTIHSYHTSITSNGLIEQNGDATILGNMTVDGGTFDLDGANDTATINLGNTANPGSMTLNVDAVDSGNNIVNGTIETADGGFTGKLVVNLPGNDAWTMAGTLNLESSSSISVPVRIDGSRMIVTGTVNVATGGTIIAADTDFADTSVMNTADIDTRLNVSGVTHVFANAGFNGSGTLVNRVGGDLTLHDDVNMSTVKVENSGTFRIGDSVGNAFANRFTQTAGGIWEVELAGPPEEFVFPFDRMIVRTNADLAGTLNISLINGYTPVLGTSHVILGTQLGNVFGAFDTVNAPVFNGLTFDVIYNPNNVVLEVIAAPAHPADLDSDGDVDGDDLALLGECRTGPEIPYDPDNLPPLCTLTPDAEGIIAADPDRDGDVDQRDFGTLQHCHAGPSNPPDPDCAD